MNYDTVFADWLSISFDNVAASKEWYMFLSELHEAVEHQLSENNVDNYHNLLTHEQQLIIERAIQSLSGSVSYQVLHDKISQILDSQLNHESEKIIRIDSNPYQTRTESILSAIFEGLVSIIDRWPILRNRLSVLLNQSIPNNLRAFLWKVILMDDKILEIYQKGMQSRMKDMISKYDKEISRETESLLNSENYLSEMKGSVGCFYGIKAVLSYYQVCQGNNKRLETRDYLMMIPFVYAIHDKLSRREPPQIRVMEVLVQEYFVFRRNISNDLAFVESYAGSLTQPGPTSSQYRHFCQQVYRYLASIDLGSAQALIDNLVPSSDKIITTETKLFESGGELVEHFLYPLISNLLIGFVPMEITLFIFDQYLFGIDQPNYREKFWPIIIAIYLDLIIKRYRKNKSSVLTQNLTEHLMRKDGNNLKVTDFQYEINKTFYVELMKIMNNGNGAPRSGLDPSSNKSKWLHWFDPIDHNGPITSNDRLEMRILRDEERKKFIQMSTSIEQLEKENQQLSQELKLKSKTLNTTYKDSLDNLKSKIADLNEENKQLKSKDANSQKELNRLLDQLEYQNQRNNQSSQRSFGNTPLAPPGTPGHISDGYPPLPFQSDSPEQPEEEIVEDEPLQILANGLTKELGLQITSILHGEGKEKFALNDETKNFLKTYEEERQTAEMVLFERYLKPGELAEMDRENDNFYSQKIWQMIADNEKKDNAQAK